jgi:hypothetical protein
LTDGWYFHSAFILLTLLKYLHFLYPKPERPLPGQITQWYSYITFGIVHLTLPKWDMIWWLWIVRNSVPDGFQKTTGGRLFRHRHSKTCDAIQQVPRFCWLLRRKVVFRFA